MGTPSSLLIPALIVCALGMQSSSAAAQDAAPTRVAVVAFATTGSISGVVLDDRGQPLDGVIVSALGTSSGFAVTGRDGQYTLKQLTPGPYLLRAHLQGYLPARNAMVSVRPSARTVSSFTLRRQGTATEPRVLAAGMGGETEVVAAPSPNDRDESETAWRLRHLKRSILKDATAMVTEQAAMGDRDFLIANSFEFLGRAVGSSAKAAGSLFGNLPLQGQVNLLTTGAFDNPYQLFELERTHSVAYFAVGAPVGLHGDWTVKAALNQGDLSSWILAGTFVRREPAEHRYQFGMSYGVHRYEGGNLAAMAAVPDAARNVGTVYASDEWKLFDRVTLGYGGSYAHYDYLARPAYFSPRLSLSINASETMRVRGVVTRQTIAPGAAEFVPPRYAQVLPPQRTFSPLTRDALVPEELQHYEVIVEQAVNGTTLSVRAFHQRVDDQLITVFGMRTPETDAAILGHYYIASAGDVALRGWSFGFTRDVFGLLRGSVDYTFAASDWRPNLRLDDQAKLRRRLPSALRTGDEQIHDITTSVEAVVPRSGTRVFFVVKVNNAYIQSTAADDRPGLDSRFDMQVSQGLPFMNLFKADWEMLVGVRNLFHEMASDVSTYDELLVARPPKRLIGGITVKF